jgi:hypothetical protein
MMYYLDFIFYNGVAHFVIPAMAWPCLRQSGNPLYRYSIWIPACAGMTVGIG